MKKENIQIEIEEITPQKAAEYLKLNRSNRKLVESRVLFYMEQMARGLWKLTGDSIKFNGQNLIDGQHRLQAVVRSGVTIMCVVVRNLTRDVFDVLDTGRSRQAGDVLSGYGYPNVYLLASAGRYLWFFEHQQVPNSPTLPNQDILATVIKHSNLSAFASDVAAHRFAKSGVIVACLFWIEVCSKTKGQVFTESFLSGIDLKVTNPIYQLRERIISDRALLVDKRSRVIASAMIFRTFDNWVNNRPSSRMYAASPSAADFPWPKGPYIT
jgi:hypothetical protein